MKKSNAIRSFAQFVFKQNTFGKKKNHLPKDAIVTTSQ